MLLLFQVEIPGFFNHPVPTFDDTERSNCEEPFLPSSAGMPVLVCLVKGLIHIYCFSGYNHGVDHLVSGCMPSLACGCSITFVSHSHWVTSSSLVDIVTVYDCQKYMGQIFFTVTHQLRRVHRMLIKQSDDWKKACCKHSQCSEAMW